MALGARGYAHRVDVQAPRELVWRGLVEPELMMLWYGPEARVTPRAGGSYWARIDAELTREAHVDVFEPGRRLRLIYMPQPGLPATDNVIVDDFLLDSVGALTSVRLLGSGYPEGEEWERFYTRMRLGWPRALARLKIALERRAGAGAS